MSFNVTDLPVGIALILLGLFGLLLLNHGFINFLKGFTGKDIPDVGPLSTRIIFVLLGMSFILSGFMYIFYKGGDHPAACIYSLAAKTDPEAISWLINQEAQAAVAGNIDLIKGIFADDARIVDYANRNSPTVWNNPIDRYQPLFKDYQFVDDKNTDIKATGTISSDTAYYISASHGTYKHNGQTYPFQNPDDANHWTAMKINGCWKITKFDFNASGIVFP